MARPLVALLTLAVVATVCAGAFAAIYADDAHVTAPAPMPATGADDIARGAQAERRRISQPSDDLSWPLHGAITGRFGEGRPGHMHTGIDIPMPAGTPIRAAAAGRVVLREVQDGYGKYTCVAHRTITTCYGHQSRYGTKVGARVRRGEVIGYVGNTGDTAAYHLHFEVRRGVKAWGTPVNPVKFLPRS